MLSTEPASSHKCTRSTANQRLKKNPPEDFYKLDRLKKAHIAFAYSVIETLRIQVETMMREAVDCEMNFAEDLLGQGVAGFSQANNTTAQRATTRIKIMFSGGFAKACRKPASIHSRRRAWYGTFRFFAISLERSISHTANRNEINFFFERS